MNSSFIVALFVLGNLVGSGFFMLPTILAPLGANLLFSWGISCFMAIVFALMFGRLCLIFPKSSVLSDYFETMAIKKIVGLVYWISCIIGNAGLLIVVVASMNINQMHPIVLGALLMLLITLANAQFDYGTIAKIEILLTVLKFSILVFLPIALFFMQPTIFHMPKQLGSGYEIASVGISSFWAFLGIEVAAVFGSGKAAFRGLLIGVLAACVLYVTSSLFIVGCIPTAELMHSTMPFSLLLSKFLPGYERYMGFLVAFTGFGALYGWVAATGKMSLFFAESKVFPKTFLKKAQSKTSLLGLWLSSVATVLLVACVGSMSIGKQFAFVADLCIYIVLLIYALCAYVLYKHAKKFFDSVLAIIGMISVLIAFTFNILMSVIAIGSIVLIGAYVLYSNRKIA